MKYVVYALTVCGAIVAITGVAAGLLKYGVHGIAVVAAGALPLLLGASTFLGRSFPRWAAVVSLLAFVLAGLKTREPESLQHIMVAAFAGMILSLVLAVVPYRAAARR